MRSPGRRADATSAVLSPLPRTVTVRDAKQPSVEARCSWLRMPTLLFEGSLTTPANTAAGLDPIQQSGPTRGMQFVVNQLNPTATKTLSFIGALAVVVGIFIVAWTMAPGKELAGPLAEKTAAANAAAATAKSAADDVAKADAQVTAAGQDATKLKTAQAAQTTARDKKQNADTAAAQAAAAQKAAADALAPARSSPQWAWFGVLALAILWFTCGALGGYWWPLALAMGADNRLSTSKLQILFWTATVGFVYAMVYADRTITGGASSLMGIPQNVLIALGISVTTTVAAQAITGSQAAANPDVKTQNPTPSYDPAALVRNDDGVTASLTKVQLLFWTLVAVCVYLVTSFHSLGTIAACATDSCSLPDIDTVLMVFTGLGHASYLGGKLVTNVQPKLNRVAVDATTPTPTVTLTGENLGSTPATITLNDQPVPPATLTWKDPTTVSFPLPANNPTTGKPWGPGDKAVFTAIVSGTTSTPITYVFPSPPPKIANVKIAPAQPASPAAPVAQTATVTGENLAGSASDSVTLNGVAIPPATIAWAPTTVTFPLPTTNPTTSSAWKTGDDVIIVATINGAASGQFKTKY